MTTAAHNRRFSQLRILLKQDVDFPLENLILVENMPSRSSQLTRSGETLVATVRHCWRIQEPNATSIEIIFVELWKESIRD